MTPHQARKRFGQHFLTDTAVIEGIVQCIAPKPGDAMVEIGPGLAAMTQPLVERLGHLHVIELDRDLARRLRQHPSLQVIESDVLKVDFTALAARLAVPRLRIVGNLPYNISTPILFHLLDHVAVVIDQHFMLQKEVVERMVATPGGRDYGRLSVMLQWRYQMSQLFVVPPQAFDPPPKVESAIVRMIPIAHPLACEQHFLEQVVTTAFSQRRKVIRNSLGGLFTESQLIEAGINPQARPETIGLEAYV
ncbi:MAG: 16S rRNA (adenine(1518)-N(6)/adenine(1519)-N(6))-dimethyltransferase RsmA, partial [Burkholderiales bacterium]